LQWLPGHILVREGPGEVAYQGSRGRNLAKLKEGAEPSL
jgi:hypothetical protein